VEGNLKAPNTNRPNTLVEAQNPKVTGQAAEEEACVGGYWRSTRIPEAV
jgi:hypothetical protein